MADSTPDTSGLPATKAPVQFKTTTITNEQQAAAIGSNALEVEDDFKPLYRDQPTGLNLIEPPYNFYQLEKLTQENNALQPCIEAMETNIDGTGYCIERRDGEPAEKEDAEYKLLDDFFKEIYPGMSYVTARRRMRRDMEGTGNAYLEVMRALDDSIAFARPVESKMVRLVELDAAVPVQKKLNRAGREVTFTTMVRERRFAMKASGDSRVVYFKEFGASRDLDKNTGLWAEPGTRLPADRRATELIHFTCKRDIRTPYGVPRWVTQTPSVMGSRHAEEHNLAFFDSGGIPPLLVFVQGGELVTEAKETLNQILNGKTKNKHRAAVMEAFSTSGSLDSAGNVRVTVERFGAERMSDSMFEKYDDKCELRIRRAFRLPPIFVGAASDYSFATAFASYTVAEAQVFAPERDEFDEVIDTTLRVGLGVKNHRVRSKPLAVKDVSQQIQAITLAAEKSAIGGEQLVEQLNQVTNLSMKFDEEVYQQAQDMAMKALEKPAATGPGIEGKPFETPKAPPKDPPKTGPGIEGKSFETPKPPAAGDRTGTRMTKSEEGDDTTDIDTGSLGLHAAQGIAVLAQEVMTAVRKRDTGAVAELMLRASGLTEHESTLFNRMMALQQYADTRLDPAGMGELAGCTAAVLAANADTLN